MSTTEQLKKAIAPKRTVAPAPKNDDTLLSFVREDYFKNQLELALPKQVSVDRLVRIITTECRKNPSLLKCTKASFLSAIMQSAQLGLRPGEALGQCYLLPFYRKGTTNCQLIIGYRGMIELAYRSGKVKFIDAFPVYEKEFNDPKYFEIRLGTNPRIKHRPCFDPDRGGLYLVYATATLADGTVVFQCMSRAEIEEIKMKSPGLKNSRGEVNTLSPWVTAFEEMAKKTVIRRLFKRLPVSSEVVQAVFVDEKSERGRTMDPQDYIDAVYTNTGDCNDELIQLINEQTQDPDETK